jgi:flagellar biosynthetic protein FliR
MIPTDAIESFLLGPIWTFVCVLSRLGPVLAMMPPLQGTMVPNRIKVLLALMISASVLPMVLEHSTSLPDHLLALGISLAKELLLGVMFGTCVMLVLSCLQIGSQIIGSLSSMELATAADPLTQESNSVIHQLMSLLAMALFVLIGGHRVLIGACLDSFEHYPAGGVLAEESWIMHVQDLVGHSLSIGIRAAAPAAIALLLANLVTALIGRTLPQLNILVVGFNVNILVMLLVLALTVTSVGWVFQNELVLWVERIVGLFPAAPPALDTATASGATALDGSLGNGFVGNGLVGRGVR